MYICILRVQIYLMTHICKYKNIFENMYTNKHVKTKIKTSIETKI